MKKILIPTDFSPESLQLVEFALLNYKETPLDVVLVHGYRLPEIYWEVLNFSARREIQRLSNPEFHKTRQALLLEHKAEIHSIRMELFTGNNSISFHNFVTQLDISDALVPSENFLYYPDRRSFDPTQLIRKSVKEVHEISLNGKVREVRTVLPFEFFLVGIPCNMN